MTGLTRRHFAVSALTAASAARVSGANDRVRLGVIGSGNRGRYLMRRANVAGGIQWVAVCDAWDVQRDRAEKEAGAAVDKHVDHRQLLDRSDIDAVILAPWDHVHCEHAIAAAEAGKDIFIEKPMTLHPMEGHRIVKAVRDNKRIVQVGTQQRSYPHFIEAKKKFIDTGLLGKITMVRTLWNGNGAYRNMPPPAGYDQQPAGMDWDVCQGGLPKIPWHPKRYFNHYVYWDYSTNAQMGGLFVHLVDVVHWYCNVERPLSASCMGGIFLGKGDRDTCDNINAILEYPNDLLVTFEANVADMTRKNNSNVDIVFMGTGGRLSIFRHGYTYLPAEENASVGEQAAGVTPDLHVANWLDCVRSRKTPAVDEVAGHYSAMACHICNISYKENRRVSWQKEWTL